MMKNKIFILLLVSFIFSESISEEIINGHTTNCTNCYIPIANAGQDLNYYKGSTVLLDGSNSYDLEEGSITYKWSAPTELTLNDSTLINPSFLSPNVTDTTNYTIGLIVNDGDYDSETDELIVTIYPENVEPTIVCTEEITVNKDEEFTLDASASFDSIQNDTLIITWSADAAFTVLDDTTSTLIRKYQAPTTGDETYTITLTADDGVASSNFDITVNVVYNQPPVAVPGNDFSIGAGAIFTLNGSNSFDPDTTGALTYEWILPSGDCEFQIISGTINDSEITLQAPINQGDCEISLNVTDGDITSNEFTATDLFISEYVEASSSANSYIEIYNGTENAIDLSNYYIEVPRTTGGQVRPWGDASNYNSGSLSGTLNSGQILVVARSSSADIIDVGNDDYNLIDIVTFYSDDNSFDDVIQKIGGDDAIGLLKSTGDLVDAVGRPGVDPGSGWYVGSEENGTRNHSLVRNSAINEGTIDWSLINDGSCNDSEGNVLGLDSEYGCSQWHVLDQNTYVYGGWHICSTCSNKLTVTITDNLVPTANAGDDFKAVSGYEVYVDGSSSTDPESSIEDLSFLWSSNDVVISNQDSVIASFVVPSATLLDTVTLILEVSDGVTPVYDTLKVATTENNTSPIISMDIIQQAKDLNGDGTFLDTLTFDEVLDYNNDANEGYTIFLDASSSYDSTQTGQLNFSWIPLQNIELNDSLIATPTFEVPLYLGTDTTFSLELTISDSDLETKDTLDVSIIAQYPVFNFQALSDSVFSEGETILLDGSQSINPLGLTSDLVFNWSVGGGVSITGLCLDDLNTQVPCSNSCASCDTTTSQIVFAEFPKSILSNKDYSFNINAQNTNFSSELLSFSVSVLAEDPVADADSDFSAVVGTAVTLNGYFSQDPQAESIGLGSWGTTTFSIDSLKLIAFYDNYQLAPIENYTFNWTQISGSTVSLSSANAVEPSFVAPDNPDTLKFELTITDNDGNVSKTDNIEVEIIENGIPTANAGLDKRVLSNSLFILDGSSSLDLTPTDTLTYLWSSLDAISILDSNQVNAMFYAPEVPPGQLDSLKFTLLVSDGDTTGIDSVNITVANYSRPISPNLYGIASHEQITLFWDNVAEGAIDSLTLYSDFQGYRIYKSQDYGATWGPADSLVFDSNTGDTLGWKAYQVFDLSEEADEILCIYEYGFESCTAYPDLQRGLEISGSDPYQFWYSLGNNTGLVQSFIDTNVVDGIDYTYTITAYDRGIRPDTLEFGSYGDNDEDFGEDDETWYPEIPDHIFYTNMEVNTYNEKKLSYPIINSYIDSITFKYMYTLDPPSGIVDGNQIWDAKRKLPSTNPDGYGLYSLENDEIIGVGNRSLESARGDTITDSNYIIKTAGYPASDISFPDIDDLDEFIAADCQAVGNGDKFYEVVNLEDLIGGYVKMEIQADYQTNAGFPPFEGYAMENSCLYAYPVIKLEELNKPIDYLPSSINEDSQGNEVYSLIEPQNLQDTNGDENWFYQETGDLTTLEDLPGVIIDYDVNPPTIIMPNYLLECHELAFIDDPSYETNWSDFFSGIRMRFDNALRLLPTSKEAPLSEVYSYPDSSFVRDILFSDYVDAILELQYPAIAEFTKKPAFEYEIEFSSTYIDTAIQSSGDCPTYFSTLLPFKVKNLTTNKYVKLSHEDNGIWNGKPIDADPDFLTPDDTPSHPGYGDCIWQPGEIVKFAADTVLVGNATEPSAEQTFWFRMFYNPEILKYLSYDLCIDYDEFDETSDYAAGDCVWYEGMVWFATANINAQEVGQEYTPTLWDDQNNDNVNDNVWVSVYGWENGTKIVLKPQKWFVDGDYWIADMSKMGKQETLTQETLNEIKVVPNPYVVTSRFNETPDNKLLRFTHLPRQCTISIFTISGELVDIIEHNDDFDGNEWWNLKNKKGRSVAPGLYIFRVESETGLDYIGKFAIVR